MLRNKKSYVDDDETIEASKLDELEKAKLRQADKNKKRDIRDWYHSSERNSRDRQSQQQIQQPESEKNDIYRRGDIPVIHGDCDGTLI